MLILVQARFKTNRHTNYLVELIVHVEFKLVKYKFTLYFMSSSQSPPSLLMLPPIVCVIMDTALSLQCLCQQGGGWLVSWGCRINKACLQNWNLIPRLP